MKIEPGLFIVGTPIGNLSDITLRALEVLRAADVIYCEDTRRTIKLLNAYEIKKPLKSCPYFKERSQSEQILERISRNEKVVYVSDAGMPGLSDPGHILVEVVRQAGFAVHIIGGVSALTHFVAGLSRELDNFLFCGFLPARTKDREGYLKDASDELNLIFFESPHRIKSTLELLQKFHPQRQLSLAKELSKISEKFYEGTVESVRSSITSFKGEWIGCLWKKGST